MPLFKTRSAAIYGVDALLIDVEVDMYMGSAKDFITVGLPDTAVRESRERIRSSLINAGYGYPNKAITVNLAPANIRKEGAGFDLPMALGIMGAMGTIPANAMEDFLVVGELSLDGGLRPVRGALPVAVCAKKEGIPNVILPSANAAEAAVVGGVNVFGVDYLADVVRLIEHPESRKPVSATAGPNGNAAHHRPAHDFRAEFGSAAAARRPIHDWAAWSLQRCSNDSCARDPMSDVLIPFGGEFLLLSQELFHEALAHGREFVPQTTEQTGREDMILDADGMAEVTQVPASWFLEQARKNKLPHLRVGKYVRFRLSEVLDFLSVSNERQPLKAIR